MKRNLKILWAVIIGMLLVLGIILFTLLWKNSNTDREYKDQLSLGEKYLTEMDYENAEICFKEAITINPRQAKPYIQLSNVYVQTGRYELALVVLEDALNEIPAGETNKVEAIEKQKAVVEELMAQPESTPEPTRETVQETYLEIAQRVLGLPYLSDEMLQLNFIKGSDGEPIKDPLFQTGIAGADQYDYDSDGQDEILVVVLMGAGEASLENSAYIHMLEMDERGNWSSVAQISARGQYRNSLYSIEVPARFEVFARNLEGQVRIFLEDTGEVLSGYADGTAYSLVPFQYQNGAFSQAGEEAEAGDYMTVWSCMQMDESAAAGFPEVAAFISNVHNMGFGSQQLGLQYPLPDYESYSDCRKILRINIATTINQSLVGWTGDPPLSGTTFTITDFQKP